ncbi:phosphatidylserine decarboxylase proenzyme 1, mitochondrial isoform X2 [Andrographis paniculata]|uniref:phosphatidylserine decarboxylase proenzyme 1, mitochondrial isoform X2 n=1 Tax=Andrographis paniculata TaxID=175694 RepID=UPI0021E98746|nr:phosphatidylserine decarboxylase proenzyme 1, mitochondrial isoform X2 [Andrographis paniculata]
MEKWRRACPSLQLSSRSCRLHHRHLHLTTFLHKVNRAQPPPALRCCAGSSGSTSQGNFSVVPGATIATILMLGALHARRLYDDKKIGEAKAKGVEIEFHTDVKARFLRLLPLRAMSRFWGSITNVELPIWLRPHVYKAWAQAFHSNLEEAQLPLEEYGSLREFFVRRLKEGSRPINSDHNCLVSPVDGIVLRYGELGGPGAMIEQVKGCSYSAASFLGANSYLPTLAAGDSNAESGGEENSVQNMTQKSWWKVSLASPKVRETALSCPQKGLFYCVIYLRPGDYHRIHSPVDWNILVRRHFAGQWQEGYLAMAAIGATNIGSIELFIEPSLRTNGPQKKLLHSQPPEERVYEPEGIGVQHKKGDEIAAFNMGSTVVLIFQAPNSKSPAAKDGSPEFRFCVNRGDKILMGEALGCWN